jgi:hypothetical protein
MTPDQEVAMRYTRSQADRLAEALQAIPSAAPKRGFSRLEMVTYLSAQIVGLQERGYTIAAIAALLTAGGFPIGRATLRTYLSRSRKSGRRRRRKRRSSPTVGRTIASVTTRFVN